MNKLNENTELDYLEGFRLIISLKFFESLYCKANNFIVHSS